MQTDNTNLNEKDIETMINALCSGVNIADVCNMSPDVLESLYGLAYNLYTAQDYVSAEKIFQSLCVYKHDEYKFWMGLAGCRQATEKFNEAIDAYTMAGLAVQLKNPIPFFYASQCYLRLGDIENAIAGLRGLLDLGEDTEHKEYHAKAKALLEALEQA